MERTTRETTKEGKTEIRRNEKKKEEINERRKRE